MSHNQYDSLREYSLMEEVYSHCIYALQNFEAIRLQLANPAEIQNKMLWAYLQTALTHSAIVSAYLFSTKEGTAARTSFLCGAFIPSEDSPLKNKQARNYLEHIDEKFDVWMNKTDRFSSILEIVLQNRAGFNYLYSDDNFIRRVLLKEEMIFIFQKNSNIDEIELNPIIAELETLAKNGDEYMNKLQKDDNGFHLIMP